jgi:hypothetical protein
MEQKVGTRARILGETVKQMIADEGRAELSDDVIESDDDEDTETETHKNTAAKDFTPRIDASSLPATSCFTCAADLTRKKTIDAFEHRMNCLSVKHISFCPLCSWHFFDDVGDLLSGFDILWHMTRCQHGGALGPIARYDFEALHIALQGRQETLNIIIAEGVWEQGKLEYSRPFHCE